VELQSETAAKQTKINKEATPTRATTAVPAVATPAATTAAVVPSAAGVLTHRFVFLPSNFCVSAIQILLQNCPLLITSRLHLPSHFCKLGCHIWFHWELWLFDMTNAIRNVPNVSGATASCTVDPILPTAGSSNAGEERMGRGEEREMCQQVVEWNVWIALPFVC
jgi:hypothetical protein